MMDRAREIRQERSRRESISARTGISGVSEKGGRGMIKVIRLNGEALYINLFQVECMESIPETKIKMMNGDYYLVKDTVESIMERAKEFIKDCIAFEK